MQIQLLSFAVQGLFFSVKFLGFMSKATKLLLTVLVGQCRNTSPSAFSV